jgi:hypothetical protein
MGRAGGAVFGREGCVVVGEGGWGGEYIWNQGREVLAGTLKTRIIKNFITT